jgi:hypothetical protein
LVCWVPLSGTVSRGRYPLSTTPLILVHTRSNWIDNSAGTAATSTKHAKVLGVPPYMAESHKENNKELIRAIKMGQI